VIEEKNWSKIKKKKKKKKKGKKERKEGRNCKAPFESTTCVYTHSSFPKALDYNWDLPIWPFYIC
jgi:hypothetical protein